ncbi:hypothetical protein WN51_06561 [Melipona quadrifasciata]|uniref:Uncharacterized protein n=1 Tax=Melipona quadrifasciata TaxID=166423 RepID=A0A0M8ZRI1_9HYME|nr:hypothetical protein WN51_06561 [Melipona quadrifasciata]
MLPGSCPLQIQYRAKKISKTIKEELMNEMKKLKIEGTNLGRIMIGKLFVLNHVETIKYGHNEASGGPACD